MDLILKNKKIKLLKESVMNKNKLKLCRSRKSNYFKKDRVKGVTGSVFKII